MQTLENKKRFEFFSFAFALEGKLQGSLPLWSIVTAMSLSLQGVVPPCSLCQRAFRNTDGPARSSTRDKKDRVIEELSAEVRLLKRQVNDIRDNGFNINHLIEFQASRLLCHFAYCTLEEGVPRKLSLIHI